MYPEIGARSNAHDGTRAASCFVVDAHTATLLYSEEGEMQKYTTLPELDDAMSVRAYSTMWQPL